jgi:FkbM family methyltransferase
MWKFMNDLRLIFRDKVYPSKTIFFLNYLKISLKYFVMKSFNINSNNAKIFGFHFKCFNYRSFSHLFRQIFIEKCYYFRNTIMKPLIIDCGSNIGLSLFFFKIIYPNCRIIAFEPDEETFKILNYNVTKNKLEGVTIFKKALYNIEGKITFYIDPNNPGYGSQGTVKGNLGINNISQYLVDAVLLSSYVNEKVDFLKLDIEGAEDLVIEELMEKGKLKLVNQAVIEYHHHIEPGKYNLSKLLKNIEDCGFGYKISTVLSQRFATYKNKKEGDQEILIYAYQKEIME